MTAGYVGRRLLQVPAAVAAIVGVGFLLIHLAPGDPVLALAGEHGDAEYYAFMRAKFGLDRPLHVQLGAYAVNVVRGDLGTSYTHGRPALDVILERLPATLLLAVTSLALSTTAGVALGTFAATRAGGLRDALVTAGTLGVYAAPVFWVAQLSLLLLSLRLGWFPVQGMTSATSSATGLGHAADVARHLALPALVLASQETAAVARLTRSEVGEELRMPYVRTARSKGLSEGRVVVRHGLRLALLPVVTVVGGRVGQLLAGAVIVELVFGWPGMGRLLVTALQTRNSPILLGIFLLVAFAVLLANVLTDLAYAWLDPRIRYR